MVFFRYYCIMAHSNYELFQSHVSFHAYLWGTLDAVTVMIQILVSLVNIIHVMRNVFKAGLLM